MLESELIIKRVREAGVLPALAVPAYGTKISESLTVGIDKVASPDTNEVCLFPTLLTLFDKTRELYGLPIPVTAGFRTLAHELHLESAGYKTAKLISPHCLGSALDLDARPRNDKSETAVNIEIRAKIMEAASELSLPTPRLGFRAYSEKFNHVDVVFLLFQPYTSLAHPATWPELSESTRKTLDKGWRPGVTW